MDIYFIEYYVRKKYNQSLVEYYDISIITLYKWHSHGIPIMRVREFVKRERSDNMYELFCRLHEK